MSYRTSRRRRSLRRNSRANRRGMTFGQWYKAAGSPRVEASQAEYALMRLRDDWAAGVDPQKYRGMRANRRTSRRLGSGKRFASLTRSLRARGSRNPRALAAWIGRRKWGSKRFAKLASAGRRRRSLRRNSRRRGSVRRNSRPMKYRAWISGSPGTAHEFTASSAGEALSLAERRAVTWWPSERGEYVHLMIRRADGFPGSRIERTILVGEQR